MFQIGEKVLYGVHGICIVSALETRTVNRKQTEYYVLEPMEQSGAQYYIPTQNQAAVSKLRPILTQPELEEMLASDAVQQDAWIADENQRKQRYRDMIANGDRAAMVCMVRALHQHRKQQEAAGRKFHLCDENFLRDAEKLLSSEFSLVLNIGPNQVGDYVMEKLKVSV